MLYDVLVLLRQAAPALPIAIQPNAGLPSRLGERLIYLSSPGYMADYAVRNGWPNTARLLFNADEFGFED